MQRFLHVLNFTHVSSFIETTRMLKVKHMPESVPDRDLSGLCEMSW